jgi:D-serine deaminase-like pyridoxal phosphate-dependent protein
MSNFIDKIKKPTLLLDEDRAKQNIDNMVEKARDNGVSLRPHFKTHQSAEIGQWFRSRGISQITVSSVEMASYFVDHGWRDITIAFPLNLRQLSEIDSLAKAADIGILVESPDAIYQIGDSLNSLLSVWLKIDVGYGRTGINWTQVDVITEVANDVVGHPNLHLIGLLTHAGHTYHADSTDEITRTYRQALDRMNDVRSSLDQSGRGLKISVGDTPGCSVVNDFGRVDEIRPGNFVFFDLMQVNLGVCREEAIAVAVACPVVAKHADRSQIVIYGGAIHLSKEFMVGPDGRPNYGLISLLNEAGWSRSLENCWLSMLTQEHGIIEASQTLFESVDVGDLLAVIPVHSCLTANLLRQYLTLDGKNIEMAPLLYSQTTD